MEFIGTAIAIAVIGVVMEGLHGRDSAVNTGGQTDTHFIVCPPDVLTKVYRTQLILGLAMFAVFYYVYRQGNPTVQMGHLIFALVFAGLGLVVCLFAKGWRLTVQGGDMELKRLFRPTLRMKLSDIDHYKVGKKDELSLFVNKRKFTTVDALCDNYDRFRNALDQAGVQSNL